MYRTCRRTEQEEILVTLKHMPESYEQKKLATWIRTKSILEPWEWSHPPNGEVRNKVTASNLKAMGVNPGIPDILIFKRPPRYPHVVGVAIELKSTNPRARLSKIQEKWLESLHNKDWVAECSYGAQDAIEFLRALGYARK